MDACVGKVFSRLFSPLPRLRGGTGCASMSRRRHRSMVWRWVLGWAALCVCLTLLCSCRDSQSSAEKAAQRGILLLGNNAEPQSLDPHKATAVADGKIICSILEGLVRPYPRDSAKVLPGMAERWERDATATVWTFHLRHALWSDGQPVTSRDFAYAYHRLLHPEFGGRYAEMLYPLRGARDFNHGHLAWKDVGVSTPDDSTLVLTLETPEPQLPQRLLHYTWFPLPAHHLERSGGMLDRRSPWARVGNWVGNGAYLPSEHRFNDFLSVNPNPRYWRAAELRNCGIRFLPIVNGYTETRMYFGGKLHISNNVPPELLDEARRRAPRDFCRDAYYCTIFYRLNTTCPPLNDERVRRALSLALDRAALVRRVVRGAGTPAFGFTPPTAAYSRAQDAAAASMTQTQREQLARELLTQAGYPGGKGFPTLELMTTSRDVQRVMAECIQAMWVRVLGVRVEIRSCEWTAYKTAQQNGEYDISSCSWSGDFLDPATFVELWQTDAGNNCTGWGSEVCDAYLAEAHRATDPARRLEMLAAAEREVLRGCPIIPLYWSERTYLKSPLVSGWFPLLLDNHPLDAVEVRAPSQP